MHVVVYAYQIDKMMSVKLGYQRSGQSRAQRDAADKMIVYHYMAGSSAEEAFSVIWPAIKKLERA